MDHGYCSICLTTVPIPELSDHVRLEHPHSAVYALLHLVDPQSLDESLHLFDELDRRLDPGDLIYLPVPAEPTSTGGSAGRYQARELNWYSSIRWFLRRR